MRAVFELKIDAPAQYAERLHEVFTHDNPDNLTFIIEGALLQLGIPNASVRLTYDCTADPNWQKLRKASEGG